MFFSQKKNCFICCCHLKTTSYSRLGPEIPRMQLTVDSISKHYSCILQATCLLVIWDWSKRMFCRYHKGLLVVWLLFDVHTQKHRHAGRHMADLYERIKGKDGNQKAVCFEAQPSTVTSGENKIKMNLKPVSLSLSSSLPPSLSFSRFPFIPSVYCHLFSWHSQT